MWRVVAPGVHGWVGGGRAVGTIVEVWSGGGGGGAYTYTIRGIRILMDGWYTVYQIYRIPRVGRYTKNPKYPCTTRVVVKHQATWT